MGVERRGSIVQLGLEKTTGNGRIGLKQAKPFMQRLDNWSRMNREIHVRFSESLRGRVPWATRLIRQYFPKKTQFNHITDQQVQSVMEKLNNRPRKCLGMKTPNQVFFKDYSFVALRS